MLFEVARGRGAPFVHAFRLALICSVALPVYNALPRPAPRKFSANLLASFGNSSFTIEGSSIVRLLNNTGFIATGWMKSSSGVKLTGVVDAPDVAHVNTTARMGLVLRISSSGEILWARRTCALPKGASLHAAVSPTGSIFIAGSRLVGGSVESYLVLARYAANGTQLYFKDSHARGPGFSYSGIIAKGNQTVLLIANIKRGPLPNSAGGDGAGTGSVAVIEAFQSNGTMRQRATITRSANKTVESEKPEDVAISSDLGTLYLLVRRVVVVDYRYNKTDTVYALNASSLSRPPSAQVGLDTGFGRGPKLAVVGDVVHVGQVISPATRSSFALRASRKILWCRTIGPAAT